MKIKFFTKEKNFRKEKESLWLNTSFYWKLAVFFLFAVFLSSLFFGYYLFMQINKDSQVSSSGAGSQVDTIKKERISKVLDYFSERKKKSNEIINGGSPVVDPSL